MIVKRLALLLLLALLAPPAFAADVAISGLPAASSVAGADLVPIVQGGVTKKATFTQVLNNNVATATALAANPTDCTAPAFANAIAASGNLTCANVFIAQTLTDAATINWDMSSGNIGSVTIAATGRTLANPTNVVVGPVLIRIIQDSSGSRTITTWGSSYLFPGGVKPTLTTAANAVDIVSCWAYDSTHIYCGVAQNYS